jgi:hypothetical protein
MHHAGNSSGVVDGSAAILLASPKYANGHGLKPRARVVAMANMGDSPTLILNAPVPAARKVLARAGLTLDDIDLFEINEAFAVVAEKFIRDLELDRAKVNVNGGSIALGHPIGATGSILIGTVGTTRSQARPCDDVRRRRHGAGHHYRASLSWICKKTCAIRFPDPRRSQLPLAGRHHRVHSRTPQIQRKRLAPEAIRGSACCGPSMNLPFAKFLSLGGQSQ